MSNRKKIGYFLIIDNYVAVLFLIWSAVLGFLIQRGQGFEIHLTISMLSLAFTMIGHLGSAVFMATISIKSKQKIALMALNYVATFYYLWATYAGWLIRSGQPFAFHLSISITSFFLSLAAHLFSALYLIAKLKKPELVKPEEHQAVTN